MKKKYKAKSGFLIGIVAARTGISVSAIRFYEEAGLIMPGRDRGGRRIFAGADIRRISFIIIAQGLGFSLAEIRAQLAQLPGHRTPTKKDWEHMSKNFSAHIDQRIASLTDLRDKLSGCIGCGCLSLKVCALYNPEDRAAHNGAGPRFLLGDAPNRPG